MLKEYELWVDLEDGKGLVRRIVFKPFAYQHAEKTARSFREKGFPNVVIRPVFEEDEGANE